MYYISLVSIIRLLNRSHFSVKWTENEQQNETVMIIDSNFFQCSKENTIWLNSLYILQIKIDWLFNSNNCACSHLNTICGGLFSPPSRVSTQIVLCLMSEVVVPLYSSKRTHWTTEHQTFIHSLTTKFKIDNKVIET